AGAAVETIAEGLTSPAYSDLTASGQVPYGYRIRAIAASGECSAPVSACVEATTTGTCTAPPAFAGIGSAQSAGTPGCAIDLGWVAAQPYCGVDASYDVYRSTDPEFVPAPGSELAQGIATLGFGDTTVLPGTDYTYIVRATDADNGNED